jgi:hypothetical protein
MSDLATYNQMIINEHCAYWWRDWPLVPHAAADNYRRPVATERAVRSKVLSGKGCPTGWCHFFNSGT